MSTSKKDPTEPPVQRQGTILGNRSAKNSEKAKKPEQAPLVTNGNTPNTMHVEPTERHAKKASENNLIPKSYTVYQSDDAILEEMLTEIEEYTRGKVSKSTIIRLAIRYFHENLRADTKTFKADVKRLLLDCL